MIDSKPRFLQGAFAFTGHGYDTAAPIDAALAYVVPADKRTQLVYLRGGNSCDDLIVVQLMQDGAAVRLFPIAARGATHVPLAVVEDLQPDTRIALHVAAPKGTSGTVVVDLGLIEI